MFANSFPDRAEMGALVARMLWEIEAVHFRPERPFTFTSPPVMRTPPGML